MRWTKRKLIIAKISLWLITFGVILPLMAQKWVFSPFFYSSGNFRSKASKYVDKLNIDRYKMTEQYLNNSVDHKTNKKQHTKALETATMVAVIITKRRESCLGSEFNCEPHYLQQVVGTLDEDMKAFMHRNTNSRNSVPIVICNVDRKPYAQNDFSLVSDLFPVIIRYDNESTNVALSRYNARSQETLDYAFCLESTLKLSSAKYLLVLEDDALAFKGIFEKIFYILDHRIEHKMLHDSVMNETNRWGWIKLYYPELWAGFGFEEAKLLELTAIAIFGASVFYLVALALIKPKPHLTFMLLFSVIGAIYVLITVLVMTRQTFLELRRLHPFFLRISPDLGCCTPAVLYSSKWITEIVKYLRSSDCDRCGLGVDLALSDFAKQNDLPCYLLEPSLVRHIGIHSTITSDKDPRSFLFYDFLYSDISNLILGL